MAIDNPIATTWNFIFSIVVLFGDWIAGEAWYNACNVVWEQGSNAIGRSLSRGSAGSGRNPYEVSDKATGTSHSLEEVEMMVHCIISLYESKVSQSCL